MDISMENVSQIVQKVRQAHWRVQRQWIGLFLLGLVAASMVAGIYLNITVRATLAGREVQLLEPTLSSNLQKNSDLETQLAGLNSVDSMQQRAERLGFAPAKPEDFTYVIVYGYTPETAVNMSQPVQVSQTESHRSVRLPEYTESLFDWLARILAASASAGGQP
jgi:cell division protein FtsL